jgi:hypothetical protein
MGNSGELLSEGIYFDAGTELHNPARGFNSLSTAEFTIQQATIIHVEKRSLFIIVYHSMHLEH